MHPASKKIKVGDTVQYTKAWIQSVTNGCPTDPLWRQTGYVTALGWRDGIVLVDWYDGYGSIPVATCNIAKSGTDEHCRIDAKGWVGYGGWSEKPRSYWADSMCPQRRKPKCPRK
jgi:hypothetical protein